MSTKSGVRFGEFMQSCGCSFCNKKTSIRRRRVLVVPAYNEPTVSLTLGQVRNSREQSLPLGPLLCSPRFRLPASATGGGRLRAHRCERCALPWWFKYITIDRQNTPFLDITCYIPSFAEAECPACSECSWSTRAWAWKSRRFSAN